MSTLELNSAHSKSLFKLKTSTNHTFPGVVRRTRKKRRNVITVHLASRVFWLEAHEITHMQGDGNYTFVYTPLGKRYLISKTMKTLLQILDAGFLRVHKSYTVNPDHVVSRLESDRLLLSSGLQIPIARRRVRETEQSLTTEYLGAG